MSLCAEPQPSVVSLHDRRLRISLMLDGWMAPFWVAGLVEHLAAHPDVRIVQIVMNTEPPRTRPSFLRRLFARHRLHDLFGRIDRRRSAAHRAAFPDRDLKPLLAGVPVLECLPRRRNRVHFIEDETLGSIREARPDVIWRVGFAILRGGILDAAPYGVWSYHHGDSSAYRGGPPGFWEVCDRAPVSGVTLQVLTPELDGGHVLGKAWMRTHPSSPDVNFLRLEQAGQRLLADAVARLLAHRWSPAEFRASLEAPASPAKRFHTRATNVQMLLFGLRVLLPAWLRGRIRRRYRPQWTVAIAPASGRQEPCVHAHGADWMTPPAEGFVADPFACVNGDEVLVFVEEYQHARNKGRISAARWRAGEGFGPLQTALDEPFHLSFPFLFEHEGRLLMMPEQHETGELWTYTSVAFPLRWEKHRRVMANCHVVDAVLLRHEGRWWLFHSTTVGEASDDNLYACHAATPFGPWTPHASSPLRSGLRGSRMAGAFFHRAGGGIIRPAQDCSATYGGALVFFELEELTPSCFREREIGSADASSLPEPWRDRCHTWNAAGSWRVFDACHDTALRTTSPP